jgi:hypothetical protein
MGLLASWHTWRNKRLFHRQMKENFAGNWNEYKDKECPERDALRAHLKAAAKHMDLAHFLWGQGYRHGDHVLEYRLGDGAFREKVLTKFEDVVLSLFLPGDLPKWEYAHKVKAEDRTQRKSQPEYSAHEHGLRVPTKLSWWS